ncbi:hypothetical protein [Actinomycetospora sp. NBRC 106375]|uniref:hypothetical protein n=1 Tax=Actinomycetospora sp. NBRC 106375 TaxID=3032207 RepID=UPI0025543BA5|nr:hypothetical protein [Actinomycetospora sp. NBRC 106375]
MRVAVDPQLVGRDHVRRDPISRDHASRDARGEESGDGRGEVDAATGAGEVDEPAFQRDHEVGAVPVADELLNAPLEGEQLVGVERALEHGVGGEGQATDERVGDRPPQHERRQVAALVPPALLHDPDARTTPRQRPGSSAHDHVTAR